MNDSMDILITRKLTGQKLSDREAKILEAWLESDVQNRKHYFQLKIVYTQESEQVLSKLKEEIWDEMSRPEQPVSRNLGRLFSYVKWAAVVVLVASLALLLFQGSEEEEVQAVNYIEKVCLPGQKITTSLPDGTVVKLNSGSRLIVPEKFEATSRQVKLEGEAFFDVVRDENRPFIIHTINVDVRVLGTSFNVQAYDGEEFSQVAVKTGRVALMSPSSNQLTELKPGTMAVMKGAKLTEVQSFDSLLVFGWMDHQLVFQDNSLDEVIKRIERWYDVHVEMKNDGLAKELFTGTFEKATLQQVMISVSKAYQLDYEIKEKTIKIY